MHGKICDAMGLSTFCVAVRLEGGAGAGDEQRDVGHGHSPLEGFRTDTS